MWQENFKAYLEHLDNIDPVKKPPSPFHLAVDSALQNLDLLNRGREFEDLVTTHPESMTETHQFENEDLVNKFIKFRCPGFEVVENSLNTDVVLYLCPHGGETACTAYLKRYMNLGVHLVRVCFAHYGHAIDIGQARVDSDIWDNAKAVYSLYDNATFPRGHLEEVVELIRAFSTPHSALYFFNLYDVIAIGAQLGRFKFKDMKIENGVHHTQPKNFTPAERIHCLTVDAYKNRTLKPPSDCDISYVPEAYWYHTADNDRLSATVFANITLMAKELLTFGYNKAMFPVIGEQTYEKCVKLYSQLKESTELCRQIDMKSSEEILGERSSDPPPFQPSGSKQILDKIKQSQTDKSKKVKPANSEEMGRFDATANKQRPTLNAKPKSEELVTDNESEPCEQGPRESPMSSKQQTNSTSKRPLKLNPMTGLPFPFSNSTTNGDVDLRPHISYENWDRRERVGLNNHVIPPVQRHRPLGVDITPQQTFEEFEAGMRAMQLKPSIIHNNYAPQRPMSPLSPQLPEGAFEGVEEDEEEEELEEYPFDTHPKIYPPKKVKAAPPVTRVEQGEPKLPVIQPIPYQPIMPPMFYEMGTYYGPHTVRQPTTSVYHGSVRYTQMGWPISDCSFGFQQTHYQRPAPQVPGPSIETVFCPPLNHRCKPTVTSETPQSPHSEEEAADEPDAGEGPSTSTAPVSNNRYKKNKNKKKKNKNHF